MKNAVIEEEKFEVKKNARSSCYRFVYTSPPIGDLIHRWLSCNGGREYIDGFTKYEIRKILIYFKKTGMELSLETEMWLAKNG